MYILRTSCLDLSLWELLLYKCINFSWSSCLVVLVSFFFFSQKVVSEEKKKKALRCLTRQKLINTHLSNIGITNVTTKDLEKRCLDKGCAWCLSGKSLDSKISVCRCRLQSVRVFILFSLPRTLINNKSRHLKQQSSLLHYEVFNCRNCLGCCHSLCRGVLSTCTASFVPTSSCSCAVLLHHQ